LVDHCPVISGLVECYYYGFSMLDYSCERTNYPSTVLISSPAEGLAIKRAVFYICTLCLLGWVLAFLR
jgi:CysZ protein